MVDFSAFVLGFREALETALIVGIVLAYLNKTGQKEFSKFALLGIFAGIIASIIAAFLFVSFIGEFKGTAEQLVEGTLMLVAAVLVSWLILWSLKQRNNFKSELEKGLEKHLFKGNVFGIFLFAFFAVLREGIELVIFLGTSLVGTAGASAALSAVAGIFVAVFFGYFVFFEMKKVKLSTMFSITSVLLILFAAGLIVHSIGEFHEAGIIPFGTPLFDLNPPLNADGSFPLLHEEGLLGHLAAGLIGYTATPTIVQIIAYFGYLLIIYYFYKKSKN